MTTGRINQITIFNFSHSEEQLPSSRIYRFNTIQKVKLNFHAIQGAEKIINSYRPVVSFEQHITIDNYNIILSYFKNKNYRVFLVDEIMPGCWPDCRNSFAFPMELYTDELIEQINTLIGRNIMIPM